MAGLSKPAAPAPPSSETAAARGHRYPITLTVQSGGAIIDSNTFNIGTAESFLHDANLGGTADGGLTKLSTGTLTLSGSDTYTGSTRIVGGALQLGSATALPSGNSVVFGSATTNGTLDLNGFGPTVSSLGIAAGATATNQIITNNSATTASSLNFATGTSNFAGVIKDGTTQTTALTVGSGSLTLSGANTFTGGTIVNGGTLRVNGSLAATGIASVNTEPRSLASACQV